MKSVVTHPAPTVVSLCSGRTLRDVPSPPWALGAPGWRRGRKPRPCSVLGLKCLGVLLGVALKQDFISSVE